MDFNYPEEITYTPSEKNVINRIRIYIGDDKEVKRLYGEGFCFQNDNHTVDLGDKGWPIRVVLNSVEKTTLSEPVVTGYQFLTFSGTLTADTDILDVWYNHFRHSDREIMESYDGCPIPIGLTLTTVTAEHYMLQTSIDLLMWELWEDSIEDGALIRDEGSTYDPEPGLDVRNDLIDKLKKKLDDAIKAVVLQGITGVRVD